MQTVPPTESPAKPVIVKANGTKSNAGKSSGKGRQGKSAANKETLRLKEKSGAITPSTIDATDKIATAAYYLAERRGFEPGHELEDWLAAEREVHSIASN